MKPFQRRANHSCILSCLKFLRGTRCFSTTKNTFWVADSPFGENCSREPRCVVTARHEAENVICLDNIAAILSCKLFKGNPYHLHYLKKNTIEKIPGSGLAFKDLQRKYSRFGKEWRIALLSQPPSGLMAHALFRRMYSPESRLFFGFLWCREFLAFLLANLF